MDIIVKELTQIIQEGERFPLRLALQESESQKRVNMRDKQFEIHMTSKVHVKCSRPKDIR